MKVSVVQSQNGIMMNAGEKKKDCGSFKNDYIQNTNMCNSGCNRACKIDEYLDIK